MSELETKNWSKNNDRSSIVIPPSAPHVAVVKTSISPIWVAFQTSGGFMWWFQLLDGPEIPEIPARRLAKRCPKCSSKKLGFQIIETIKKDTKNLPHQPDSARLHHRPVPSGFSHASQPVHGLPQGLQVLSLETDLWGLCSNKRPLKRCGNAWKMSKKALKICRIILVRWCEMHISLEKKLTLMLWDWRQATGNGKQDPRIPVQGNTNELVEDVCCSARLKTLVQQGLANVQILNMTLILGRSSKLHTHIYI